MTTLDDLLTGGSEEAPPPRRRRPSVAWLVKATLMAAVLAGAVVAVLRMIGYGLPYPIAFAGLLALLALRRLVRALGCDSPARPGGRPRRAPVAGEPDQLASAVQRWQTRLSWGRAGIRPFARTSPLLAELVGERLRLRHGVTLDSDPVRARTLLGERLWAYLTDPAAVTPSPRDLAALLTDVEKL